MSVSSGSVQMAGGMSNVTDGSALNRSLFSVNGAVSDTPTKVKNGRVLQKMRGTYNVRNLPKPPYPKEGLRLWIDPNMGERNSEWYGLERSQQRITSLTNLITGDKFVPLPWSLRWLVTEVGESPRHIFMPGGWDTDEFGNSNHEMRNSNVTSSGSMQGLQFTTSTGESFEWSSAACSIVSATRPDIGSVGSSPYSIFARISHTKLSETAGAGIAMAISAFPIETAIRFEVGSGKLRAIIHDGGVVTEKVIDYDSGTGPIWLKIIHNQSMELSTFYVSDDGISWIEKCMLPNSVAVSGETYYLYLKTLEPELLDEVEFTDVSTGDDYQGTPYNGLGTCTDEEGLIFDPPFDDSNKVESRTLFGINPFYGKSTTDASHDIFIVQEGCANGETDGYNSQCFSFVSGTEAYKGKRSCGWIPTLLLGSYVGMFYSDKIKIDALSAAYFVTPVIYNECYESDNGVGIFTGSVYDKTDLLTKGILSVDSTLGYPFERHMIIGGASKTNLMNGVQAAFSGALYEVIAYDRKLSDEERASVIATIRSRRAILTGTVR
jgi:hypothetical protein